MRDQRLEQTIQRIERALARIAAAADAAPARSGPESSELEARHDALRNKVRAQLARLDNVIGEFEE
ncbi:hypothetical protein [Alteriqipengyuania sp. 357]